MTHICWNLPTDVVIEGSKLHLPYTRSVLRPILVHTSLNAHPIQGIGQAVRQVITNNGRDTVRVLGGYRQQAQETHYVANKNFLSRYLRFLMLQSRIGVHLFATN